ncbi:MAG: glycoside hydrolase family 140 protein [Chloroflexi bacterium]|nr:glycoside hydrolase family 140 protein [Chloroflexota bacterium]
MTSLTQQAVPGPLRVSANGRYFVDQNGAPFFWLGDTQWQLAHDFALADVEAILSDRARKGFTVLQVMLTGIGDGTKPNLYGHTPWLNHNPATPNKAYFEHVDAVVASAARHGLVLVLYVCHGLQRNIVTPDNARHYAAWVARRYKDAPHILWAFVTRTPIADELPLTRELAAGIQAGDGGHHLISYHPDPVRPALSSGEIHAEPWLAFNMIQTWAYYEGIYGMVTRDYHRTPTKPVVMAEGAYEDESASEYGFVISPLLVRKQAYWSFLSGGFHTYGHSDNWRMPSAWKITLDAPAAAHMGVLKRLFTARDWWNLLPDQSLITNHTHPGSTLHTAARASDGRWAIVYLSSPTSFTLYTPTFSAGHPLGHPLRATWIDPRDGTETPLGNLPTTEAPTLVTPPGWEDAVLLVDTPDA